MGHPIDFKESNFTWTGWAESDARPGVLNLHAHRYADAQGVDRTISCWALTWRERLQVLRTGRVWLHVIGRQPPVSVGGTTPFKQG